VVLHEAWLFKGHTLPRDDDLGQSQDLGV